MNINKDLLLRVDITRLQQMEKKDFYEVGWRKAD